MSSNGSELPVFVGDDNFLIVGGIKVCRAYSGGLLEFKDKNRFRSAARGSEFITITIADLVRALNKIEE